MENTYILLENNDSDLVQCLLEYLEDIFNHKFWIEGNKLKVVCTESQMGSLQPHIRGFKAGFECTEFI